MRSQIHLVDPGTNSNLNLLPLAIGLVGARCGAVPEVAEAFDIHLHFLRQRPEVLAESLDKPSIVGLSAYVWNLQASLLYAKAIRRRHPDCLIVLGGASIPKSEDRAVAFLDANPMIDVLVQGEGEETFAELAQAVARGGDLSAVSGVAWRTPGGIRRTPARPRMTNLSLVPSPFLNGSFDALFEQHRDRITGAVMETNRGCPYSCTFCDWGGSDSRKIRSFDVARTKAEIDWVVDRGIPYIFLADANFGIFPERDYELADHLAECRRRLGYPRYMGINWTKTGDDRIWMIADRLSSAGIQAGVTLAAQSFHPPTLAAIKRRNLADDKVASLRERCHGADIVTYNDLILGLPEETLVSFLAGLDRVMTDHSKDHWVVHLCNILENTEIASPGYLDRHGIEFRECKVRMTLRVHDPDEVEEHEQIVVSTRTMPTEDWRRAYDVAYMSSALHNFRTAFFVMNLFKAMFGGRHTDFVAFALDLVRGQRQGWPILRRGVDHLERQRMSIEVGVARYSPVEELGGFNASPQEALLAMFLDQPAAFYADLRDVADRYCAARGWEMDPGLLDDAFAYQAARMNIWQPEGTKVVALSHDVHGFFTRMETGSHQGAARPSQGELVVAVPRPAAGDRFEHARQRTRGARYTDMLSASWRRADG